MECFTHSEMAVGLLLYFIGLATALVVTVR